MNGEEKARQLIQQADDLRNNGQEVEARKKYQEATEIFEELGETRSAATAQQMIGVCYKIENKTQSAIAALEKASQMFASIDDHQGLGNTYRDIGIAYAYIHKHEKALEWLQKSADALEQTDDAVALGITLAKIGYQHLHLGNLGEAEKRLVEGLQKIRGQGSWFMEMTALMHLAELEWARGSWESMLTHLWACLGLIHDAGEAEGQKRRIAQISGGQAWGYLKVGNVKYAEQFLNKALDLLDEMPEAVRTVVYDDIQVRRLADELKREGVVVEIS